MSSTDRSPTLTEQPASKRVLTVLLPSLAYLMVTLDVLVVVTALPSIHRDLGGNLGTLQWTVNAYNIAFGAGIITAAVLGDRLGRRRVYVFGLLLFTLSSAACALAGTADQLVLFRTIQGLGAAVIMPLGLTLLTSAFPAERRGAVVGIWGGIAGLGVASGPLIGGAITQGLSWHWVFWVNVPVGVVAAIGSRMLLGESRGEHNRIDFPALVLVAAGVAAVAWGLVQGGQRGWADTQTVSALVAGFLLVVGFVWWELRAPEPMIPLGLFRNRTFSGAVSTNFLMSASILSAAFLTSQFFQFARGDSPLATGLRLLPWTAAPLVIAPISGALFDKIGARRLIVPGLVLQGVGFIWVAKEASVSSGYGGYVIPFIIAGVGISMALPCISAAGLNAVAPEALGKGAGVLNTMQQFGAVFGIAIITVVFNAKGSLASPASVTAGFRPALLVAAALSLLGAVTAMAIRGVAQVDKRSPEKAPDLIPSRAHSAS